MTYNPLWERIQQYMDDSSHRYPPKPADLARETGISNQVISKWKARPVLPTPDQLLRFAQGTGIDYLELLQAALVGRGYLPIEDSIRLTVRRSLGSTLTFSDPEGGDEGEQRDAPATRTPDEGPGTTVTPLPQRSGKVRPVAARTTGKPTARQRKKPQEE